MKREFTVAALVVATVFAPIAAYAQHGGHGTGRGGRPAGAHGAPAGARGVPGRAAPGAHPAGGVRPAVTGARGPGAAHTAAAMHHGPGAMHHAGPIHHPGAYGHRPGYHGGWYHGDWHHGYWGHPCGYRPWGWYGGGWGWGLGIGFGAGLAVGVAFGSPWYWGYYPYYNPYWVAPVGGVTYINYGQPIVVAPQAPATAVAASAPGPSDAEGAPAAQDKTTANQEKALAIFDNARNYFKRGDYQMALAETNKAVALVPNDTLMHEFRGLCLFAMKDYRQSAAAVYAVLSIGPGWDSSTVDGLYPNPTVYSQQLAALEKYSAQKPNAPEARFLLAYHYMLRGKNDQAIDELQTVVELQPKDTLSAQLLKSLTTKPEEQPPALAGPEMPDAPPVEAGSLVGNWKCSREDGSQFELTLSDDNKFTWLCAQEDKKQKLAGTYTFANNYLILTASGQNALVGQVTMTNSDKLKFKLAGGSPADPGLLFSR